MSSLSDLQVLDFSRILAGPFATMLLADLGAEVIKVERPGTGDDTRAWGPPYDEYGSPTYFQSVNRNKRSVVVDLNDAEQLPLVMTLAREADILVENFRPGVMDRLGLGYEALHDAHPGLIYCSITGFGPGEGASFPGYDLLVQALGGLMSINGPPGGEPQKVGVAVIDVLAGLFAAVGMLAALRHRERTGMGQHVEVDLLSSILAALVNQSCAYTIAGVVPTRMGNSHPSIAPYELYPTADGELVLAVGNDRQFAAVCSVLGQPDLAADPRFVTNAQRVKHRQELRDVIEPLLAASSAKDWALLLTRARVPAGQVNDIKGAFELAEALGLDPIAEIPREDGSLIRLPRNPINLSETPATYRTPPQSLPQEPSLNTLAFQVSDRCPPVAGVELSKGFLRDATQGT